MRAHTHHSCAYSPYIIRYNTMRSIGIYTRNGNGLLVIRLFKLWLMYVFRLRQTNELEIIFLSTFGHLASLFWIWQYITLGLIWSQRLPVCVCVLCFWFYLFLNGFLCCVIVMCVSSVNMYVPSLCVLLLSSLSSCRIIRITCNQIILRMNALITMYLLRCAFLLYFSLVFVL